MNNYYVYLHTNKVNGKVYIGITSTDPKKRWANGRGYSNQYFSRAIRKYGWDGFEHEVLYEGLSETQAKIMEISLIHFYKSTDNKYGYNVSEGGDVVSEETRKKISETEKGKIVSEETRKKLSEAKKGANHPMYGKRGVETPFYGKTHTDKTRKKLSEIHKGKVLSEETRKKLSEINKGHIVSKETRKKISEANKGANHPNYGNTGFNNPTSKSCICLTTGFAFGSTYEAAIYYNIANSNICNCCNGKVKSAGKLNDKKLQWKYIKDLPKPPMTEEDKRHLKEMLNKFYYKKQ